MREVAAHRLDVVIEARMYATKLICSAVVGLPVDAMDLSTLDREVVDEMVRLLVDGVAQLAVQLLGSGRAVEETVQTMNTAWSDWKALRAPSPDLVPAGWCDCPEELMEPMYISSRIEPPARRCDTCTGELPSSPPFLVDRLGRRAFCDGCAVKAGYPRSTVNLLGKVRGLLAKASTIEQIEAALALLDRD